jgi:hypothetical protein
VSSYPAPPNAPDVLPGEDGGDYAHRKACEELGAALSGDADSLRAIVSVADEIEQKDYAARGYPPPSVDDACWGVRSAADDAASTFATPEEHRYLVRLAAWALVALRAARRAA